jgi:hypothetical protein
MCKPRNFVLIFRPYSILYNQYLMHSVVNSSLYVYHTCFIYIQYQVISSKTSHMRTWFDIVRKSPKLLLEITTLVSSANIWGSVKEFILRGSSFVYITNNQALELTLQDLHVSMHPSQKTKY